MVARKRPTKGKQKNQHTLWPQTKGVGGATQKEMANKRLDTKAILAQVGHVANALGEQKAS